MFFIQDAIKFPDLVHSVKQAPDRGFPQAQSAHDNFWDFISLMPEATHMVMWTMSDRAIPRSFRFMEGFGVHTFRFVNAAGRSTFVKFHWKPKLGLQSVVWNEAVKINGADPDFHRRDLWDAINSGDHPEWELGVQLFDDDFADRFDFDVLDATKLIPEELVPVRRVGRLVLDRTVDNFFAETEQVAFCTQNVVPGIDFTIPGLKAAGRVAETAQRALGGGRRVVGHNDLVPPRTSFNGRVSPHRRFAFGQLSLDEVKAIKNEYGATVNDVIVSICAGAVRRWLIEHRELPAEPLVAQIPVSVRKEAQQGTYGNRILIMSAPLFTNEADPVKRLELHHEALLEMKERHKALPAELLQDANQFVPPAVFSRAARLSFTLASSSTRPARLEPRDLERAGSAVPALPGGRQARGQLPRVGGDRRPRAQHHRR